MSLIQTLFVSGGQRLCSGHFFILKVNLEIKAKPLAISLLGGGSKGQTDQSTGTRYANRIDLLKVLCTMLFVGST